MRTKRQMSKAQRKEWRTQVERELRGGTGTFCMIPKRHPREPKGALVRPLRR